MPGRLTLGLFNTYDTQKLHEIHRRSVARASALCYAFDINLALFGFPLPKKREEAIETIKGTTTIGGGEYIEVLADMQRLNFFDFPVRGFPPQLGTPVATTSKPHEKKLVTPRQIRERLRAGESILLIMGLGRRGLPKEILESVREHLELTGKSVSLETCTAMGVIACLVRCEI